MENMKIETQSFSVAYVKSQSRLLLFGTFELTIYKPVEIKKSYISQKKSPISNCLKEVVKLGKVLPWNASDKL